jgi:hypothetical protein
MVSPSGRLERRMATFELKPAVIRASNYAILQNMQGMMGFDPNFTWLFVQTLDDEDKRAKIRASKWYLGPSSVTDSVRLARDSGIKIVRAARVWLFRNRNRDYGEYRRALLIKRAELHQEGCTSVLTNHVFWCSRCVQVLRTQRWLTDRGHAIHVGEPAPTGCLYARSNHNASWVVQTRWTYQEFWQSWGADTRAEREALSNTNTTEGMGSIYIECDGDSPYSF